jgi:L-iditol 2-dehydrogenase
MKAAILYGKEHVQVEEVESKPLSTGQVRIHIEVALTCGTDLKVYKRGYHARMITPPAVFGHELAGTLSEVASDVTNWHVGDRVVVANSAPCGKCFYCQRHQENLCDDLLFLNGAYAESIAVPERLVAKNLLRLGKKTDFEDAALVEPLACVVQGIDDLKPVKGEHALVIGAGPIGLMFVALLRHAGCTVTIAGKGETRLKRARALGAERVIDAGKFLNLEHKLGTARFDLVIEAVGQPRTWEASVRLVRKGGRVNFFGGCPAGTTASLDTTLMHYSNLMLLASFHHTPRTIRKALGFIESGLVQAADFVDGECSLLELPKLFASMVAGNRAIKTLVRVRA